ncbi:MAG: hypothetical protein ING32_06465 [Curvibacter sp.]|jgi:putative transposase|nr:hypothetical protein [Curvibacter sp.]
MPRKAKQNNAAIAATSPGLQKIPKELIYQFVCGPMNGELVNAATVAFKKTLIERALGAELGHHLGQPSEDANHPSDSSATTALTGEGAPVTRRTPRTQGQF